MKKLKEGKIKIDKLKFADNSRLGEYVVDDLMESIKKTGLLQPVGVRDTDNTLIYGYRRVDAYKKLGYQEIECIFYTDVSDANILLLNLSENVNRENIGAIEMGRICFKLKEMGLKTQEIAAHFGDKVTPLRINSAIMAYQQTIDTPYEKYVTYGSRGKSEENIPQTLIHKIQTSLTRARSLTKYDWDVLLQQILKGELTSTHLSQLRGLLLSNPKLDMKIALDILGKGVAKRIDLFVDRTCLNECLKKEKIDNESEFFKQIIRRYNANLLYPRDEK